MEREWKKGMRDDGEGPAHILLFPCRGPETEGGAATAPFSTRGDGNIGLLAETQYNDGGMIGMSKLLKIFKAQAKDVGLSKVLPSYSTGFAGLDYRNGYIDEQNDLQLGFEGGKFIMFIGKSGVGKTTLALQVAANMVRPFENGALIHLDYERATNPKRFRTIVGWTKAEVDAKYDHRNTGIYAETIYNVIEQVATLKLDNYEELKYDTGRVDAKGKTVWELPPTIVLVDSIPGVSPRKMDEKAQSDNNMRAAQAAKVIGTVVKQCAGLMQEANVFMFSINHIHGFCRQDALVA
jgi:energy-coupling factor transporter ATP-binding protein EcfA2